VLGGFSDSRAVSFSYCNGGFVVLALLAGSEWTAFYLGPACVRAGGMGDTAFLRSDGFPRVRGNTSHRRQLAGNVFHLPVRGSGTAGSIHRRRHQRPLERSSGRIVSTDWVNDGAPAKRRAVGVKRYGLGFWLHASMTP
jgi:hypothetical protein